jgi:outer membrane autotransporter protein
MVWYNITAYNIKVKFVLRNNKEKVICNNKNAEGEMQMKCKRNLERAIVLGVILSTGVCGSAWAENVIADVSGTGKVLDKSEDFDNINVIMEKADPDLWSKTTCTLIVRDKSEIKMDNANGDFTVVNNIKSDITLDEIQNIQNTQFTGNKEEVLKFAQEVINVFNRIETFENNALFARDGSTIDVKADDVKIIAAGGFTGLNAAISAENAQPGDDGNNTISISGNKVEIVGDIDMTQGALDDDNSNTVNITLNSADSYWYGSERRIDGWENSELNVTLANGAEWVYDNNSLLGKEKEEILQLIKDTLIDKSFTSDEDANQKINAALNIYLRALKQVSSNEGSEISAITLEGGIVNLQDEDIKQKYGIYESDIIDLLLGNKHQKVTIGELKGSGGIFKVDLDWETNKGQKGEKDNSDYIYIKKVDNTTKTNPVQIVDFDASKAHLEKMKINEDKLYFANVADGNTSFTTLSSVYSNAGNVFDYTYGTGSDNGKDWYIAVSGKSAESNPNFSAAKGAMYAGYALGTELDTLNKRMGETRYLEENDGVWVRYRHSKTGWDDTYETNGDMFQLGFDNEVTEKDGKHYRGVAIDYTDADTNIMGISGEGEHERYAVSLYDTWLGEKGHYRDLVLRGGRINSDYDISGAFSSGYEDIGGDYHQWFGSISAEWGRKNDMGTGWYFEPQVQAQLARIGGASYVSDSGVDVDQDGATSLIGRAGFRIGREYVKDNGKHDNFYIKADLLHEFAGDKSFSLTGNDGRYDKEYDGQETWCDVGIGADISLGKNSYFWADVERTFGADFDNTWQINGGFRWEF